MLFLVMAAVLGADPGGEDLFERRVRPVLAEHCFGCHGVKKQSSGLRLDSRVSLVKGGDNGPAVVPGEPGRSLLIEAVKQSGDLKMPPKGKLSAGQVAALEAWVKAGAPWPEAKATTTTEADAWKRHWAFQPVRDPPPPPVRDAAWARTTLDRFLLAALEARGLAPSPEADRATLIRRVTFDLLGLPPTPDEVRDFLDDPRPGAYERLVDRLLASPHHGERWARHWLDVARYADTKGYVFFEESNYPWAYTYRDYVLRALNEDRPYDRFVLEQLAADKLPLGEDRRPLTALGFLTAGGRFMNNQYDILDDRIDVVTRGLLGLTVTCARCHDHKFDPVTLKDYYALYGVFASCAEPSIAPLFEPPPRTEVYAKFEKELRERERKLTEFVRSKHVELLRGARERVAEYLLAAHAQRDKPTTEQFMLLADGNDLNPTMIVRWQVYLGRTRKAGNPVFVPWHALADLPPKDFAVNAAALAARWLEQPGVNPLVARALAEKPPASLAEAAQRYADLLTRIDRAGQDISPGPLEDPAEAELWQVFYGPGSPPVLPLEAINNLELLPDRPAQAKLQELGKAVEKWRAEGPGAPPRAMTLEDLPVPHAPRVFLRGNPNQAGDPVARRYPAFLSGDAPRDFHEGSGRLELARAITDRRNPLTARVLVNRVWMHHVGRPLVGTPSDFGLRSDPPTHPDLLDHLATALAANGWSLKYLHRQIVLSAAYRQQSLDRPDGRRLDPDNNLLWRMNRRRLDFEATRDALLAAAGSLDRRVGGPSARDVTAPASARRTLYGHLDRLNVPGLYRTFDFPSPDATSPRRDTTTVAPQALFLMNHPFVLEAARRLARRPELTGESDPGQRISWMYRLLYGRPPGPAEAALAREYLGSAPDPAAWERYAHALLVANEFVFVD